MAYVNGEWLDDDPENQGNPMAGLANTSTPTDPSLGSNPGPSLWQPVDYSPEILKSSNYGGSWSGINSTLQELGNQHQLPAGSWSKALNKYYEKTGSTPNDQQWWGPESGKKAYVQGLMWTDPEKYATLWDDFSKSGKYNDALEKQQAAGTAATGMAAQNQGGDDDFFGSLLPLLIVGGLGLATGGFGFGALAGGLGEGALASTLAAEGSSGLLAAGAAEAGAGALGGAAFGDSAAYLGGFGDAGAFGGDTLAGMFGGDSFGSPGLYDMFNTGGLDFEGASSFMGNPGASATNLEQALQIPNVDVSSLPAMEGAPTAEAGPLGQSGYETIGPIDPATSQGLDAPIRELSRNAPIQDQARLGLKGLSQMTNSPGYQIPKTLYNLYSQNQKAQQLEKMMSRFEKQSDVGGPFRDILMRSLSDPNFFKSMPEFNANMASFNQQYGAQAAKAGTRSQLGGAAHNIAVNREGSRLADIYRSRIGPLAAMQPNMSGMAAMAPALANAQGNQFNSLFDPQLWKSLEGYI